MLSLPSFCSSVVSLCLRFLYFCHLCMCLFVGFSLLNWLRVVACFVHLFASSSHSFAILSVYGFPFVCCLSLSIESHLKYVRIYVYIYICIYVYIHIYTYKHIYIYDIHIRWDIYQKLIVDVKCSITLLQCSWYSLGTNLKGNKEMGSLYQGTGGTSVPRC